MIVAGVFHFLMHPWSVGGLARGWLVQDGLMCMTGHCLAGGWSDEGDWLCVFHHLADYPGIIHIAMAWFQECE